MGDSLQVLALPLSRETNPSGSTPARLHATLVAPLIQPLSSIALTIPGKGHCNDLHLCPNSAAPFCL